MDDPTTNGIDLETHPPQLGPFDWSTAGHVVVRAGEAVDWDINNPDEFIKRVQSIEYGLSAESEFAAILSWLGRCALVHRFDQDCYSSKATSEWAVPDLLAIFEHGGARVPTLIEVKTTKRERLAVPAAKLRAMHHYANLLSLPLLFAWKPRRLGFWLLVDPCHFSETNGKSVMTLESALKNNLLSSVAGDFIVVPTAGTGLFLEFKILKKVPSTATSFECVAQITNAEFRDGTGLPAKNIPAPILALMFSGMDELNEVDEGYIRKSWVTESHPIHAQQILRTCVALRSNANAVIKWRHVGKQLASYMTLKSLHDAIQSRFGTFVQYQFFQHPQKWPSFLPSEWNSLPCSNQDAVDAEATKTDNTLSQAP